MSESSASSGIEEIATRAATVSRATIAMRLLLGEQRRMCGELASDHCERVGDRVAYIVAPLGEPRATQTICAGILHDVLEDAVDWNEAEARAALRDRIVAEFGEEVLRIVEAVTVDQRLGPEDQFAILTTRAREEFQVPECLVRLADIHDNWLTRQVYSATYLSLWERYARRLVEQVIPGRLHALGWTGSIPFALLEPPGP